jgi:hypothetical protein
MESNNQAYRSEMVVMVVTADGAPSVCVLKQTQTQKLKETAIQAQALSLRESTNVFV